MASGICGVSSAEHLQSVSVPTPSAIVGQKVGTLSVCEASAILASQAIGVSQTADCQTAADKTDSACLRVTKRIFRQAGHAGAVTVAIAQSEQSQKSIEAIWQSKL
ncbi:MAG: cobalamin biosynthesis protein [Leptolyngbyaceae cyanobacterium CRU_2_3]|nr:cobalamin biosynthesis protein [Leptolyngbyaceae cyanobacterium CRU_2_3]